MCVWASTNEHGQRHEGKHGRWNRSNLVLTLGSIRTDRSRQLNRAQGDATTETRNSNTDASSHYGKNECANDQHRTTHTRPRQVVHTQVIAATHKSRRFFFSPPAHWLKRTSREHGDDDGGERVTDMRRRRMRTHGEVVQRDGEVGGETSKTRADGS